VQGRVPSIGCRCDAMISSKAGSGVHFPTRSEKSTFTGLPTKCAGQFVDHHVVEALPEPGRLQTKCSVHFGRDSSDRVVDRRFRWLAHACMLARNAGTGLCMLMGAQ
jgi:hypothetical protein